MLKYKAGISKGQVGISKGRLPVFFSFLFSMLKFYSLASILNCAFFLRLKNFFVWVAAPTC